MLPENRLKRWLNEGRIPLGHMLLEFASRGMPRILEQAGLDFAIIDTEHTGFSDSEVADVLSHFRATAVTPIVRIPQIDYPFVARALDRGALGIMAPNVRNGEQARRLVDAAKYPPDGERGVFIGGANTSYQPVDARQFLAHMNEQTAVICQIESTEGLANLDAIAATPGVDVLWLGHFDLSVSMGLPGQFDQPRFLEAMRQILTAARRHGKAAGIQPRNTTQAAAWIDMGYNVISLGADIFLFQEAIAAAVHAIRGHKGGPP